MTLIVPDKNNLGDMRLNEEEGLAKIKERNRAATEKLQIPNQALLGNEEAAQGRRLPLGEFLTTLGKMNPLLVFKPSSVWGRPATAIYHFIDGELKYLTGFFTDESFLPEYSFLREKDERGLYSRMTRGWREVIVQLVRQGALKAEGVKKFGNATGIRSTESWEKQLKH